MGVRNVLIYYVFDMPKPTSLNGTVSENKNYLRFGFNLKGLFWCYQSRISSRSSWAGMTLNCIHIFIVTGSFCSDV